MNPGALLHSNASSAGSTALRLGHTNATGWNFVSGVSGNTDEAITLQRGSSNWLQFWSGAGAIFSIDGTEAYRVDTSQRLLVGTHTARGDNKLQVEGGVDGAGIFLRRDVSAGALTTPGTYLGTINFGNTEGGIGAYIRGESDAAWSGSGSTDNPCLLYTSDAADE